VRAATTLRSIDAGRAALPGAPPTDWRRRLLGVGAVVALIAVVWWALSTSSAQRLPGQQISGLDPRDQRQVLLSQARSLQTTDPAGAASLYKLVLDDDPNNAEALTYRGWTLALAVRMGADVADPQAQLIEAVDSLVQATEIDPRYADPQCFLGVVYGSFLEQAELALPYVDRCLTAGPPADVRGLVEGLRDRLQATVDGG
jgi:tetratricopeptide (TPR) repeat protein